MKKTKKHYRTVLISDVHLGTKACNAERLIEFLDSFTCDTLYLIGDIIDCQAMGSKVHWPQSHSTVVQKVLKKSNKGTKVYYILGNHDDALRKFLEFSLQLGNITLLNEHIYIMQNGKKFLITHGDQYDYIILNFNWLAWLGYKAYDFLIWVNRHLTNLQKMVGLKPWSLSKYMKTAVKGAVAVAFRFEHDVTKEARKRNLSGTITGHIHIPEIKYVGDMIYANSGDWCETCSALVETDNGDLISIVLKDDEFVPVKILNNSGKII